MIAAPPRHLPLNAPRLVQLHHEDQAAVRDELLSGRWCPPLLPRSKPFEQGIVMLH